MKCEAAFYIVIFLNSIFLVFFARQWKPENFRKFETFFYKRHFLNSIF